MQETKKTYTIHAPQTAGTEIFNKEKYILKVVSETDETAEIILEEKEVNN